MSSTLGDDMQANLTQYVGSVHTPIDVNVPSFSPASSMYSTMQATPGLAHDPAQLAEHHSVQAPLCPAVDLAMFPSQGRSTEVSDMVFQDPPGWTRLRGVGSRRSSETPTSSSPSGQGTYQNRKHKKKHKGKKRDRRSQSSSGSRSESRYSNSQRRRYY